MAGNEVPPWIKGALLITVTVVWVLSFILNALISSYDPPPSVDTVFLAAIGGVLLAPRKPSP